MERQPLTSRQREILDYMESFTVELGYPPTVREICKATGLRSPRSVSQHLQALERKGYIERGRDKSRAIRFLHKTVSPAGMSYAENVVSLPLMGKVVGGHPTMATDGCEARYTMDRSLFEGRNTFVMRIDGDCLVGAHIMEGDLVVVDPEVEASDGDIVVAAIGQRAIVRRYLVRNGGPLLASGNGKGQIDLSMHPTGVHVVGKVVGLIRKLS